MLKQSLQDFLERTELLNPHREAHFVVAYSGGRDSTALLHCLHALQQEYPGKIHITAAYYWHPWRPLQEDLEAIHQNCKQTGAEWIILTPNLDLPKTETAAREDRYKQLAQLASDITANAILTAHHEDDQVETILFRLVRGTGLEGLRGIPEMRTLQTESGVSIPVARPMLQQPKQLINDYLQTHQLRFVDDPTNTQLHFKRNFLRHEILPALQGSFPQVRQSLIRLSELAEGDLDIIDIKIDEVWQAVYTSATQTLDETLFTQLARPFQRRVIRRYLAEIKETADYSKVEDIIDFIAGKNRDAFKPGLFSLGNEKFLSLYRNQVNVVDSVKQEIIPLPIWVPGEVSHQELRATLSITRLSQEQRTAPIDFANLPDNTVYVDLSQFEGQELTLRSRRAGDRIKPLGMTVPVKLKKFFINRAIPRFQRDTIPLLATHSDVLWAVGYGLSNDIRVKDRPTHRIQWTKGPARD